MSMKSFVNDEKGYETIELMEDSVLYMLERGQLYRLFEEDIHIANWGRKFAEKELLKTEERLIPCCSPRLRSVTANASRQSGAAAPSAFGMPCLLFGHYASQPESDKGGVKMTGAYVPGRNGLGRRKIFLVCKTKSMVSRLESGFRERAKLLSGE